MGNAQPIPGNIRPADAFEESSTVAQSKGSIASILRIGWYFLSFYRRLAVIVFVFLFLSSVVEGIGLLAVLPMLSIALGDTSSDSMVTKAAEAGFATLGLQPSVEGLLIFIVMAITLKAMLIWFGMRFVGNAMAQVQTDLRLALTEALMRARWSYFVRQSVGRLANAFATEPDRASGAVFSCINFFVVGTSVGVYLVSALLVSPWVSLAAAVSACFVMVALGGFVRRARTAGQAQTTGVNTMVGRLTDVLQGLKPIKAMGLEDRVSPLVRQDAEVVNTALRGQVVAKVALRAFQEPIAAAVLAGGMVLAFSIGGVSMSELMVLGVLFWRTMAQVGGLQKMIQSTVIGESALWSIRDAIAEAEAQRERPHSGHTPTFEDAIVFDRVVFSHDTQTVIDGLSMTIPANRITALVGASGAGKTTILDLVTGLYEPKDGRILVDGVSLADIDLRQWRRLIGYVPQETFLFNGSVFVNVTMGCEELSEDDVRAALSASGALAFVEALPEGWHTHVGERGQRFSGGQRQRLAIARALVRKPRLLVLDEATTAMDPTTERQVCETLREISRSVGILAVSHQPMMSSVADQTIHLEKGKLLHG